MAGLSTGTHIVQVYHEKSRILPDVARVLACLYEKDIKFETHTASYKSLLKLQASTHAPVPFYDGPTFLEESREICRYIAEKYEGHGYPFLLGKDALERASVEQWLHNEEHAFNPPSRALFCHLAFPLDKDDNGDDINVHIRKLEEVLEVYEQRLSDSKFLAGNKFTLADLVHFPNSHYITASEKFLKLYDSRKNVRRWWDAISTRDSWQHVLMDMKRVEEQSKQVELKEQHPQQKNHPRTPDYPLRIHSQMQTPTEPRTVLHPHGTVLSSPIVPQTEKPRPIDISDEPLVSSSQSTPTDHGISVAQSKETPFQKKPPQKSHIPVQSTIARVTFPTTSEKRPTVGATRLSTKDDSSKDVQQHPPQDSKQETSGPVLQESMSMELVQGQEKINIDQRRDVSSPLSEQTGSAGGIAVDDKASFDERTALQSPSTPKHAATGSRRAAANEAHGTTPPQARYQDGQDTYKQLRDPGSIRQRAAQTTFGGSSDDFRSPLQRQDLDAARHTIAPFQRRDPLNEDTANKTKGIISAPWQMADQDTEDIENITEETKIPDSSSSLAQHLYFQGAGAPSGKQETTEGLIREKETTDDHHGATSPIHNWHGNIEDIDGQHREVAFKPKQMIRKDDRDSFRESKFGGPSLPGERSSDTWETPTTTDEGPNQDGLSVAPPLETTQTVYPSVTASKMRYPSAKDANKQPRGAASTPKCKEAQDDNDTSEGSTIADEVASNEQPSNARRAPISPRRQEVEDSPRAITSFQKGHPYVEDMLVADTLSRQIAHSGVGKNFEEKKIADSSPASAKPMYTQQSALPQRTTGESTAPSANEWKENAFKTSKVQPTDSQDNIREEKTSSFYRKKPSVEQHSLHQAQTMPTSDKTDVSTPKKQALYAPYTSDKESSASAPFRSKTPDDHSADDHKSAPPLLSKELASQVQPPSEPSKGLSTEPSTINQWERTSSPLDDVSSSSDDKEMAEKKIFSTERVREMVKESESTTLKAQPNDSGGSTKKEKPSSIYQKRPLAAEDSQEQAQIIPAGEKADGSTIKHQQSPDAPYTLDEKFNSSPPERADIHDDPRKEASYRKYTTANQKVAQPLLSQKPTSHVLPPSEPYHDAAPHEELSSSKSIIEQWQRAAAPLKDTSIDSDHSEMKISSNIKEKPMPMSQEPPLSSQHVNQIAQQSGEQTLKPPVPIGEISGVQHAAPLLPDTITSDHAIIGDKFAKKSIIDERLGEPKQTQAPIRDAHRASRPSKGRTPDGNEPDDLELTGSSEGQILDAVKEALQDPATIHKDSHHATIDEKIATYDADDDQLVTGSLHEQVQPPAPIHETVELIHGPTSKEPQLGGASQAEVAHAEHKSTLPDKKIAVAAEPLSPTEPVTTDGVRQQTRPSASIIRRVPTSDNQNVAWKIQEVTPDNLHTDDSAKPLVPSQGDEISHATKGIPRQEDMTYSPSMSNSPKSDYQFRSAQVHEVTPYASSEKQGSHVRSASGPDELGPAEKKFSPSDQGLGQSAEQPSSAESRKEQPVVPAAEQIKSPPRVTDEQGTPKTREVPNSEEALDTIFTHGDLHPTTSTKPPRKSFSLQGAEPTSSPQAPPLHVGHESMRTGTTPDDGLENVQSMKPSVSPDAQHGITPRSTADDVTLAEHKFVPSGQDSVHSKQLLPSPVQRNEVIGDSAPETLHISSTRPRKGDSVVATPGQAKGTPTTADQQEILSAPVRSVSPSLETKRTPEKAHEDACADDLGEFASRPLSDIIDKESAVVPASAPAAQHGAATYKALDKQKIAPSGQDSVHPKQPSFSTEQKNGEIGDSAPLTQWISSTKPRNATAPHQDKDPQITPGRQDILPPVRSVSQSSDIQHPSDKVHDDVRADDLGEAKPIVEASAPHTQDDTASYETSPAEKKIRPSESTSSIELRNGEIRDSAPSSHLASSTETTKENATIIAAPEEKDLQTTLDQPDIASTPIKSASPFSDTHSLPQKAREDAPADDLREASSKPFDLVREVRPSTVFPASPPGTQHGAARDETLDKQKFVPSGQDSVHSTLPRNGEIGDSAPSTQQISPTRPRRGDIAASAPDQAKDTQITLGQQEILPPVTLVSSSSDTQLSPDKAHEDLPAAADDSGEAKPIVQASVPNTQEVKKFVPSGQISSAEPKNKEIRDSAPSTRLISSTDTRKEDSVIAVPDQDKDSQTTFDQQDMLSTPVRFASPSSDTQNSSEKAREDAPADLGDDASKPLANDKEIKPPTAVPASSPATLHGAAPDETVQDGKKIEPPGQGSTKSLQPSFPSEPTKEDTIVMAADQTKDPQTMIHQQNITPTTDTAKTPLPGTKGASSKIQERNSDGIDNDKSVPGEEQVSLGQGDSHRREGHATEPYGSTIDEKTTTTSSREIYSSESGSELTRVHTDVHPSIDEGTTATSLPEHGVQIQPPLAAQSVSLDASSKAKSTSQEAEAPIAAASETQPGPTQAHDESAPIEHNFLVSDQESAHASKSPSTAGLRKGETYDFGPTDQTKIPEIILGNQITSQTPDAREALSKFQESSHDNDQMINSASPLISQEQASHAQRASEEPTSEAPSAFIDKKTTLPSSQVKTSNTGPDSTPITGDAHLTNADIPAASTSQNQEAQSPAVTQAPTTQALQGSASAQDVYSDSFENRGMPRQPSQDEFMAPVTSSAAYSDAPNIELGTATVHPPQKASFDLSGGEKKKTTTTKDDLGNTLLSDDLSRSRPAPESTLFKGTNSEQKLEGASTYDKSKAQHQNDQSDTPSSKDNNKEANEAVMSDLSTPYREQEKQSWPNKSMEPSGELEHQKLADKAIGQSPDNNLKQIEQTKTHDTETGEPEEREPQESTNQTDNEVSGVEALDSSDKQTSGVQLWGEKIKDASKSSGDAPDLPENSSQNYSARSQAETSGKSAEKLSPGIQDNNKSSSGLEGPTEGTKSDDFEDKSG